MKPRPLPHQGLDPESRVFYQRAMRKLRDGQVPFLVGGAYSFARYTGIERHTKDFDIFVRPADCQRALDVLAAAAYQTELTFPHWLGKATSGDSFIDIIFGSGNGVARVDDQWFEYSVEETVLEVPVRLCPAEETIWSKAFVMERERYDGADIAHLLRAWGRNLDWNRVLARFGPHWRVLLSQVVLFGFIYPDQRDEVPDWVMQRLIDQLHDEMKAGSSAEKICQGTLFSRAQYLVDIEHWGYRDARLDPASSMSQDDIDQWTAAIADQQPTEAVRPTLGG